MKEATRAIITNNEGKVLLGKRARGVAAGQYALVGGKPDSGEEPIEAVIREVKEEIGVRFRPTHYLTMLDAISDPSDTWRVYYYTGEIEGNINLKEDEIEEVVYIGEDELDVYDLAFDHRERLNEYFQRLKQ